jgi:transcriptional regulator with XRE-family HTH domain
LNYPKLRQFVGKRLRELRTEKGHFTQAELARRARVSADIIGKIERCETTPSLETLNGLCQAFRISLSEFLTDQTNDSKKRAEKVYQYLLTKKPEYVHLADKVLRALIEELKQKG